MWRCIAARSRQVAHNFGALRNFHKVPNSHALFPSSSQSHFSKWVSSKSLPPHQNPRLLSNSSVNSRDIESEHSRGDDDSHIHQFAPINDSSAGSSENSDTQLGILAAEGDISALPEEFSQALSENGGSQLSWDLDEEGDPEVPGEEEEEVYEIDAEKLETLLSLLQSSADGSLESTLESMDLDLHEDLVVKVLETPLIPGDNLIRFFKWAIKKSDFSVSARSVDALVRAICSDLRKKDAYALWDLVNEIAEKESALLNVEMLNHLIALFSKLGKGKAAMEVFNKLGEFGCVPNSETFYYTIEALCRRSMLDWASSVCVKMLDSEALPDSEKLGKIICQLCKGDKATDAHMVYLLAKEKNKHPPQSAVNFLIHSLSQKNETVKFAADMLDSLSGETRKYAINRFSSVIRGLCRTQDLELAKSILSKMIDEGPPPGNAVFNSIINCHSKLGDLEQALEMKGLMQSRGLKPDLFTYTVIMSGYVNGGLMEEACKMLSEAKKEHSKLIPVMYHTLIRGYCKLEQFDKALDVLEEMKDFGVKPNVDEYNKLIQSLCLKALDWERAEELLKKMKEEGLNLNGITKGLIRAVKELEQEQEGLEKGTSIDA